MNARICSVIAALTLMTFSSGCSGVRNFLFGRGARCGSCTNLAPRFGNTTQAPCNDLSTCPTTPEYGPPQCAAPTYQGVVTAPSGCGCNEYSTGQIYAGMPCGDCGNCGDCGSCGCGTGYGPAAVDPYLSGADPYAGQIIGGPVTGGQIVGESVIGNQPYSTPIQPDDFTTRNKFDSDGNRILWEEPIPDNATSL